MILSKNCLKYFVVFTHSQSGSIMTGSHFHSSFLIQTFKIQKSSYRSWFYQWCWSWSVVLERGVVSCWVEDNKPFLHMEDHLVWLSSFGCDSWCSFVHNIDHIPLKIWYLFKDFLALNLSGLEIKSGLVWKPGVIWGLLLVMTQTAQTMIMPTQMTITVAMVGTIMFRSNHSGKPGNWDLETSLSSSPAPNAPPIFSIKLIWKNWITWFH